MFFRGVAKGVRIDDGAMVGFRNAHEAFLVIAKEVMAEVAEVGLEFAEQAEEVRDGVGWSIGRIADFGKAREGFRT